MVLTTWRYYPPLHCLIWNTCYNRPNRGIRCTVIKIQFPRTYFDTSWFPHPPIFFLWAQTLVTFMIFLLRCFCCTRREKFYYKFELEKVCSKHTSWRHTFGFFWMSLMGIQCITCSINRTRTIMDSPPKFYSLFCRRQFVFISLPQIIVIYTTSGLSSSNKLRVLYNILISIEASYVKK